MAETQYRRLTRGHLRTAFAVVSTERSSLWLGSDHLLRLDTTGYSESYKRFYFRDIQALILRRTANWIVVSIVFGAFAALSALIALLSDEPIAWWIFGGIAGICLLLMTLRLAGGPSCRCHVRTAVQTEELPSLCRLRRARRVLDQIRPLIIAAQGQVTPEELPARLQQWRESVQPAAAAMAVPASVVEPIPPPTLAP